MGCDRLRPGPHGKEGVSGSSPEEGSSKPPQRGKLLGSISVRGPFRLMRYGALSGTPRFDGRLAMQHFPAGGVDLIGGLICLVDVEYTRVTCRACTEKRLRQARP